MQHIRAVRYDGHIPRADVANAEVRNNPLSWLLVLRLPPKSPLLPPAFASRAGNGAAARNSRVYMGVYDLHQVKAR